LYALPGELEKPYYERHESSRGTQTRGEKRTGRLEGKGLFAMSVWNHKENQINSVRNKTGPNVPT